ncbi:MAG: nitronate monooxygenase [Bdellovibrionaceae bacterium]|nr:nitronate monooxygenase [Pseudobdellovibrionaceae bacterium]
MGLLQSEFSSTLGLQCPLIVAPMAGGPSTVELVVASSEAGALGSIGAAYLAPAAIKETIAQTQARTRKPFAVNLFIPTPFTPPTEAQIQQALAKTKKFRDEFHLTPPDPRRFVEEDFDRQFEAVLSMKPAVLSFVFGPLPRPHLLEAKKLGITLIGTATSPEEALELQESGLDAITLQGIEAGGHRGIFDPLAPDPEIPLMELLRELKAKIKIPLIAAGGIMNRADIEAALRAGAAAVQMGTAFLATTEAGTSGPYRRKLLERPERETRTTRVFSGRLARGIRNRFMEEMDPRALLPFPVQNQFTRDLRGASAQAGSADFLSLWCGTGKGPLRESSAAELIRDLFAEGPGAPIPL